MTASRFVGAAGFVVLALVVAATGLWGALALAFTGPGAAGTRTASSLGFGLAALTAIVGFALLPRWRWQLMGAYAVLLAAVGLWWSGIQPSNDREWQPDMALLPYATIDGDQIRVHNIRNFDYRSEADYTPAYYDKTFSLQKLTGVDLIAVYWMGPAIAHTFLSFEFDGDEHLAVSIETRKKKGDAYSTLKGFFRQYELAYVVADERDVIRLRTNYRRNPPEDVYVLRLGGDLENGRRLFTEYMRQVNSLKAQPQFYNTLTTNCTTDIWANTLINDGHLPLSWKILVSGYVPQYLYEAGRLDTRLPFDELMRRSHVNKRAQAADAASDFSRRIRVPADAKPQ